MSIPVNELTLNLRRYALAQDEGGHAFWVEAVTEELVPAASIAIVICDVWDAHWSRGASERVEAMVPRINAVLLAAREHGVHIVHAPSETMDAYGGTPGRQRAQNAPNAIPPDDLPHEEPPLPIDSSDGGSDTGEVDMRRAWHRQHPGIRIDHSIDAISDSGREVYSLLKHWQTQRVLLMGVHTNMCILNRPFGIKQMVRWGVPIALVRDLTDTMYNPARAPYVDHDEGTKLVVAYIERFWCPTVASTDLLRAFQQGAPPVLGD